MANTNKEILLCLLSLTKSNKIRWALCPEEKYPRDNVENGVYECEVEGRTIVVYSFRYKHYQTETDFLWAHTANCELIGEGGFRFGLGADSETINLVEAVHEQWANTDDFLKKLKKLSAGFFRG